MNMHKIVKGVFTRLAPYISILLLTTVVVTGCVEYAEAGTESVATPTSVPTSTATVVHTATLEPIPTETSTPTVIPNPTVIPSHTLIPRWCPMWPDELDTVPDGYSEDYLWNEDDEAWAWAHTVWSDFLFSPPASILEGYQKGETSSVNDKTLCPNMFSLMEDIVGPLKFKTPFLKDPNFSIEVPEGGVYYQINCIFCYPRVENEPTPLFSNVREFSDPRRMCLALEEATMFEPYYGLRALDYSLEDSLIILTRFFGDSSKAPYCSNLDPDHEDYLILYRQLEQ